MDNDNRASSSKKPPMEEILSSSGTQRTHNPREDSTMQSEHAESFSISSPMRVAAMRPEHHEFKIAGDETGGTMRQKTQPSNVAITEGKWDFQQPFDQTTGNRVPKEFQHRDQNFQPLQTQSNIEQRGPTGLSSDTDASSPYHGLTPSFFRKQAPEQQRTQPERADRTQATSSITPEMSVGSMFGEGQRSSSGSWPSTTATGPAQQQSASMPSRSPPSHTAPAPIHQSAMTPARHLVPEHGSLPAENIGPIRHTGISKSPEDAKPTESELRAEPMHRTQATPTQAASTQAAPTQAAPTQAAPTQHAPSSASASDHHKDKHIETIHQPYMPMYHAPSVKPTSGHETVKHIETIHQPYHGIASQIQSQQQPGSAMPDSAAAPTHQTPISTEKPSFVLGKSHDESIPQAHLQQQPPHSQHDDAAGLNAASYPTSNRPSQQHGSHPSGQDVHSASPATEHPKKLSKRERKAAKREEASKDQGILESISTALIGRKKNNVSTPEMRLGEIFKPFEQQDLPEEQSATEEHRTREEHPATEEYRTREEHPVAEEYRTREEHPATEEYRTREEHPVTEEYRTREEHPAIGEHRTTEKRPAADAVHAGIESIRSIFGHIHMPNIISRHSPDSSPTHGEEGSRPGTTSNYGSSAANQYRRKHVPSTACALKKPKINLLLYPEEQPDYLRDETPKHQNPDRPKSVMRIIEIPYRKPETHHAHGSEVTGHGAHGPSLARMILDMQAYGDGDTAGKIESQPTHGTTSRAMNLHPQGDSDRAERTRPQMRHVPGPMILDLHTHGDRDESEKIKSQSAYGSDSAPMAHPQVPHSTAAALKKPKANLSLYEEEEADYPRGDIGHYSNQPDHPDHPSVVTEVPLSMATATPGHQEETTSRPAGLDSIGKAQSDLAHTTLLSHLSHLEKPHSTAAALKKPKANLSLYEEEEANYPRGDIGHYSNKPDHPDHPSVVTEVPSTIATAAPGHLEGVPTSAAHLDSTGKVESDLAHATLASRISRLKKSGSTAAALKKPKLNVMLFPEEEADYPHGDQDHHINQPACPINPISVKEIQLDSAHRHPHHDLHPSISETAATAVSQGLGGIKSLLGSMNTDNAAAAAVMSGMGAAARHHLPSAPEVPHQQPPYQDQREHHRPLDSQSTAQTPYDSLNAPESHEVAPQSYKNLELDLSLDTPRAAPAVAHGAAPKVASVAHSTDSHEGHAAPVNAPDVMQHGHYTEPTASQVHTAPPKDAPPTAVHMPRQPNQIFHPSEHHSRHMEIHAILEDIDTGEYYTSEDETESHSLTDSISSSIMRVLGFGTSSKTAESKGHNHKQGLHQEDLKPNFDSSKFLARKWEPASVLPPASRSYYTTPDIHDDDHMESDHLRQKRHSAPMMMEKHGEGSNKIPEQKSESVSDLSPVSTPHSASPSTPAVYGPRTKESQESESSNDFDRKSEPASVIPSDHSPSAMSSIPGHYPETKDRNKEATSHAGPRMMESHGAESHQQQQPWQTSHHQTPTAKIPIAQPPVQTSSVRIPTTNIALPSDHTSGQHSNVPADTKAPVTVTPVAPVWEAPASSTIHAAAPLMAATVMHVKPDEVESWKTTKTEPSQNLSQHKDHQYHDDSAPMHPTGSSTTHATAPLIPAPNLSQHKDDHDHDASAHSHPTGSSAIRTAVPLMAAAATSVKPDEVQVMEAPEPEPAQSIRQGKYKDEHHHEVPASMYAPGSSTPAGQPQHMHTPSAPTMDLGDQAKMMESSGASRGVTVVPPIADTGVHAQSDADKDDRLDDKYMHRDRDIYLPSQQYQKPELHRETKPHSVPLSTSTTTGLNEQREQQQRQEEYLRQQQQQQANTGYGASEEDRHHGL
ncbi:hypothetical protein BGZ50_007552 [Haplosporangium sp. Z 11]|nr:hypothetical protein BGZ50_007552 [Haplosporangium sp. Z 11]